MTPFDTFVDYLALKRHFTDPNYDYFRYNGKVKANKASFDVRKDKIFFERLAKHAADPHTVLLSNIVSQGGKRVWICDIAFSDNAKRIAAEHIRFNESLTYNVKEQLKQFDMPFDKLVRIPPNGHPPLLESYITGSINLETVIVVVDVSRAYKQWKTALGEDPIAQEVLFMIDKYRPFVTYDEEKIRKVIVDVFMEKQDTK